MAAIVDDDTQSIVVGNGNERVAIDLKQPSSDQSQSLLVTSIIVEMGDLEIHVRRSTKSKENTFAPPMKSKSLPYQYNDLEKTIPVKSPSLPAQNGSEEKPTAVSNYWDYSASYGPLVWSRIFPQLAAKKFQSPIRIYTDQCEYEPELARQPFQFEADENCCQTLENTGTTFQVSGKGHSRISGGPVPDEYRFLQFHIHWGSNELEGAEHVIDGVRLPGEFHLVTWNTSRYRTAKEAAASEQFDGLMVFAVLIRISSSDNPEFAKVLNLLSKVTYKGEKVDLDQGTVSLKSFLPKDLQKYYTYDGSLTTPMCAESVRWVVFREITSLSRRQFDQLRQLKCDCRSENSNVANLIQNSRPPMPLNGRVVYRSFN